MFEPMPEYKEDDLTKDVVTVVLQINGKLRSKLEVPNNIDKNELEALALADENVQKFLAGLTVRKVIIVPGKLVNVVAN